ncbi:MAG: WcaI family glycosyltransferase [Candidatus Methylacidiphilales bacterium]|nr:WcaI family glycosyltransferase [Candidatus Methylacidiphilales bacterium]
MRILIIGLNYAPEAIGIAVYTSGLAEALTGPGNRIEVIAGRPYYPDWRSWSGYSRWWYSSRMEKGVKVIRCPHYVPAKPSGPRRILHHASFALTSLFPSLWCALRSRPQLVLVVAPSLIAAPIGALAALVAGAKSWLHVQDLEVDAALATGLVGPGAGGRFAHAFERWVLRLFGRVSSISEQMCSRIAAKGVPVDRVSELRNWADVDEIRPIAGESRYRAEWEIKRPHVALYAGNIANKQGIEIVIEAARRLAARSDLIFVICGQGPNRSKLEQQASDLDNVLFRDLQPRDRLADLLGLATVHLLPQLASAADLVLPSKLGNMLASGRPVVATAGTGTGLERAVKDCGFITEPENGRTFADAIERLVDDEPLRAQLGRNARLRAESSLSRGAIVGAFASDLARYCSPSRGGKS